MTIDPSDVRLGDRATVYTNWGIKGLIMPSIINGEVTMISRRGVNVSNETGTRFAKWGNVKCVISTCHVHDVEKYYQEKEVG